MNLSVTIATAADDEGLRRLARTQTMPGRVRLAFCREPDFSLGCAVTGDDHIVLVARAEPHGDVVGVACRSTRRVFLNGRETRIGYLGQLRVDTRCRGRWLVSRGFAMLGELHRQDPVPAYLASIVDGNDEATSVLVTRRRRGFPVFREVARYVTLALPLRGWRADRRGRTLRIRRRALVGQRSGSMEEVSAFLRRYGGARQLMSVWTEDALQRLRSLGLSDDDIRIVRKGDGIAGLMALWDQSAYKQSVVRGYSGWLRAAGPLLPRSGTELRSVYASLVCVADDDPEVFAALLGDTYAAAVSKGFDYLLLGFDLRDPLLEVARTYAQVAYPSRLYLASWPGGLPHESLDPRPTYVDIATL